VDLHGRGASPCDKGEQVGDAVVPFSREKISDEEICGRERSDRGGKEERNPSRYPFTKEVKEKKVRRGGKPRGVFK
jgi:hypothetical protein